MKVTTFEKSKPSLYGERPCLARHIPSNTIALRLNDGNLLILSESSRWGLGQTLKSYVLSEWEYYNGGITLSND